MKLIAYLVFLMSFSFCMAVTRYVPGDYATIQAAINASSNQDIVLISDGVYQENIDFLGKAITVSSLYHADENHDHISNTIIDANGAGSVATFALSETQDAVLKGVTLTGGNFSLGAGISIRSASPTIMNCIIHGNSSAQAAGVFISNSNARLVNLSICDNDGKGLKVIGSGSPELSSCIVYYNSTEIYAHINTKFSYCNLETPWEGAGNISTDPLMTDHAQHNYSLQAGSPCVNTGSPYQPAEHDGTRPDMGAIHFHNSEAEFYANFEASETLVITANPYQISFEGFIAAFNCNVGSVLWDFGDGESSTDLNPSHTYAPGGYFDVSLTVSDGSISYVESKARYITIFNDITANFPAVLDADHSPYYLGANPNVHHSVTISEGVDIYLNDYVGIVFYDDVNAIGTQDAPITFQPYNPGVRAGVYYFQGDTTLQYCYFDKYDYVYMHSSSPGVSADHCRFENTFSHGVVVACMADFTNCHISNCGESGINIWDVSANISHTTITNCAGCSILLDEGVTTPIYTINITDCNLQNNSDTQPVVYCGSGYEVVIAGCDISSGAVGIQSNNYNNLSIYDCNIHDNLNSGIRIGNFTKADIYHNRVHGNSWGIYLDDLDSNELNIQGNLIYENGEDGICVVNSSPLISNNTIVQNNTVATVNTAGIWCSYDSSPVIVNNIIWDHLMDIQTDEPAAGAMPVLSHNLLQYSLIPTVIDSGNNFIADPLFLPGSWYNLSAGSPAIDSGNMDPQYYSLLIHDLWGGVRVYDGDNNGSAIIDRGCNEYCPTAINDDCIPAGAEFTLNLYPNPMQNELKLQCGAKDATAPYSIAIYNIRGQKMKDLSKGELKGNMQLCWNGKDDAGRDVAAGIYIVQLKGKNLRLNRKLTLIR